MKWSGATALVTGASRGIGRAVAKQAAAKGARVGLLARNQDDLEAVRSAIGGTTTVAPADIAVRAEVDDAVKRVEAELGPIDILVANAGIGAYGPFADIDVDVVEHLVQVNLLGTVYPIKAVLAGMLERGRGHIVVVSSVAGRFGSPLEAAYASTKLAQIGLAEALSVEVAGKGVGVSIVNPGVVDTDFFAARGHLYDRPFPKPISADRVAAGVIDAVEKNRAEVFVPGPFKYAVAVRHVAPRLYRWGTRRSFKNEL